MTHFQGKTVPDHLKEARKKGAEAAAEVHGTEMAGHKGAFADAGKETAFYLLLLWVIVQGFSQLASQTFLILTLFSCALLFWKTGRSALLGWARLERVHRVIEEERWEIEHHRAQERAELKELYMAKGFSGKLLEEVVDVLMADDNRLLQVMLDEELGLPLEAYEHPLKQALGAFVGVLISSCFILLGCWALPKYGVPLTALIALGAFATVACKFEKNRPLPALIWNLSIASAACAMIYFLLRNFVT